MNISTEQKIVLGSPVYVAVSGFLVSKAAELGFPLSQTTIRDVFIAGSAGAALHVVTYLKGRQDPELMKLKTEATSVVSAVEKVDPSLKDELEAKAKELTARIEAGLNTKPLPEIVPPANDPAPATPLEVEAAASPPIPSEFPLLNANPASPRYQQSYRDGVDHVGRPAHLYQSGEVITLPEDVGPVA